MIRITIEAAKWAVSNFFRPFQMKPENRGVLIAVIVSLLLLGGLGVLVRYTKPAPLPQVEESKSVGVIVQIKLVDGGRLVRVWTSAMKIYDIPTNQSNFSGLAPGAKLRETPSGTWAEWVVLQVEDGRSFNAFRQEQ